MNLLLSHRSMLNALGNNQELTLFQPDITIPVLHPEPPFHHQEQLVFMVMLVPHEFALKLHQLDMLPVQLTDDLRAPVIVEQGELLPDVHLGDRSAAED